MITVNSRDVPLWLRLFREKAFGTWLFDESPDVFFDELAYWDGYRSAKNSMPKPRDFLSAEQRDGSVLQAQEIYTETWQWLKGIGCAAKVSPQLLERYAMCSARWVQCEEMTNRMGFLSKHPTTEKPIPSPFIGIGINYMNQAVRLWNEIFQIVKENCSTEYGESTPQDDLMERLLRARKG